MHNQLKREPKCLLVKFFYGICDCTTRLLKSYICLDEKRDYLYFH